MKDAVVSIIDHLEQDFTDITVAGEQLWEVYGVLQRKGGPGPRMHQRAEVATSQD